MGKILTTLRQTGPVELNSLASQELRAALLEDSERPGEASADGQESKEEMPYIEIGPRRTVEGSPGVLDSVPRKGLLRPHGVQFRQLPSVAGPGLAPELAAYHAPGQPEAKQYGE